MALRMPVAGAGEAGFHSWAADGLSGAILALSDCTTPSVRCNGKARNGRKLVDWSADRAWDTARLGHRDGSDGVPRPMRENSGRLLQLSYTPGDAALLPYPAKNRGAAVARLVS